MKKAKLLATTVLTLFLGFAGSAHADPVTSTIVTVASWLAANAAIVSLAVSVGTTLLGLAAAKNVKASSTGISTQTTTGGSTPQTFVVGRYATGGQLVTPLMSFGADGKTPNAYLTYVVALGCVPGQALYQLIINDKYVTIGTTLQNIGPSSVQGYPIQGDYAGYAWIRYHDGTQTVVDPFLEAEFSSYPTRPWNALMVGYGIPYAVLVFKYNSKLLNSPPSVRFELGGIPLYDPRLDTTVGGSGSQRWGTPSTYVSTENPAVIMYNIHRGIALTDGSIWGGESSASDLPLDNWFTAMNECDVPISLLAGGTEPQYRCGLEISVSDTPASILDKIGVGCAAQQVEIGGIWKIRIGGPGMPVLFFTDDDILIDHDQNLDMFPSLDNTNNGIQATYPLPSALWASTDAPPLYNSTWEAQDGGRRLVASVAFDAVYSPTQVQRLMASIIADDRRFRNHALSMGPYASQLEPLDAISWTSASQGYTSKTFEVTQTIEGVRTINMALSIRERDSSDFNWSSSQELPYAIGTPGSDLPIAQDVPSFAVAAGVIKDASGNNRRPTIVLTWDGTEMPDVQGVYWEVRLQSDSSSVASGTDTDVLSGGVIIVEGLLPSTQYQVRAQLVVSRPTNFTSWISVTTLDIPLSAFDIDPALVSAISNNSLSIFESNLEIQQVKALQQALTRTGNGTLVETVVSDSVAKSDDSVTKLDLIGALGVGGTAFILDGSTVKITPTQTLAQNLSDTSTAIGNNTADITTLQTSVGGLSAVYTLKVSVSGSTPHIAGIMLGATNYSSDLSFFASSMKFVDDTDPTSLFAPFSYSSGVFTFNSNVVFNGGAIFNGTVSEPKIAANAVSDSAETTVGSMSDLSTEILVTEVVINPSNGRVRLDWNPRVGNTGGSDCAVRIKIFRNGTNISGSLLYISRNAFTVPCQEFLFDDTPSTSPVTYSMTIQTVTGTGIGDTGGTPYVATLQGCTLSATTLKK